MQKEHQRRHSFAVATLLLGVILLISIPQLSLAQPVRWSAGSGSIVEQPVIDHGVHKKARQSHITHKASDPLYTTALRQPEPATQASAYVINVPIIMASRIFEPSPTAPPVNPTPQPTPGQPGAPRRIVGYFTEWGIYARNYHVKNIATSGSAAKLTHINYAFGNVENARCKLGDTYADFEKAYSAAESVDGVADVWDQPLRGNFNQLRKLKAQYPHLKVLISLGGWTWSKGFSDAAMPQNRSAFVRSCIDLFISDARWNGLFDGIDIDWEYPAAPAAPDHVYRPEDTQNFTALLAEFRSQLNTVRPGMLLTIAAPAGQAKIDKIQVAQIQHSLDFINLMTYDFHGAWENRTNFNAPLYQASGNPASALRFTTDESIRRWRERGAPAEKLTLGAPFYGQGWQGVPSVNNGLWQNGSGGAPGKHSAGIEDYKILKHKGLQRYYNAEAQNAWLYGNGEFWTYDDPETMRAKMRYIAEQGLGGVMFWELSGDTENGELISVLHGGNTDR